MNKLQILLEAERRGMLPPDKAAILAEARRRGMLPGQGAATQPEAPKERLGFWNALKESAQTLGLADEAAAFAANPTEENRRKLLAAGESKFQSVGGFGKGENWEAFKELLGGSIGQMVAPIAAGTAASVATPIAGLAAGYGTATAQYTAQNLLRQAQEQERALAEGRTPEETSALKAAGAGAAAAGLDYLQFSRLRAAVEATPFLKNLITPSEELTEEAAKNLVQAARDGTLKSTARGTVTGAVKGTAFEVPQEVAQTALERWQAGLSLSDQEARDEYTQAAIGAAILGPVMGGAAGALGARAERKKAVELEEKDFQKNIEEVAGAPDTSGAGLPAEDLAEFTRPVPLVEQPPKVKAEEAPIEARQEPANLSPKQVQDEIAQMEQKQQIRSTMLSDLDALKTRIESIGGDYETGVQRLTENFDSTATRLDIFRKHLESLSRPPEETPVAPMAPIPQVAAAQQTIQIDSTLAKSLNLPGAEAAPKDQPFTVPVTPMAPIPQAAAAQQALGLPSATPPVEAAAAQPAVTPAAPVAPIPQVAAAQQALPINVPEVTTAQAPEVPRAAEPTTPRVAETVEREPVGGGVALPPPGPEPAGRVSEVPTVTPVGTAAGVAPDVVSGTGTVEPALAEKPSDKLFNEIEGLKKQALSLLVGKYGKRPAVGTKKRKEYDALQVRIEELTGQWGRQVSKEQTAQKAEVAPPGLKPMADLQGVELNDLGNAIGKAIKALPPLTDNVRDAIRRILDLPTISDNLRSGVYAFLSLHQQAQLFIKEIPALKEMLRVINSRAGALKARREDLDRNVRKWSRILRENNAKMDEFFEVANESSRLQVDFKNLTKEDLADSKKVQLRNRFNALPDALKDVYWQMLKSYSDMADEYINLVTKNVSASAASQFRAAMAERRLKVYLPLYREGDYWLRYQDANNETVVRAFEDYEAREAAKRDAAKQGATGFQSFSRIEDVYSPGAVGPFFDKVVKELEAKGISKEVGNALYNLYLDQIPASSVRQQFRKREGILGYENNLIKVYSTVASRMANQLTNLEYVPEIDKSYAEVVGQINVQAAQSDSLAFKKLEQNLKLQMDYIRDPVNSSMVNGLSTFSYYWYIIGNVSTAFINLSQIPMVAYPMLAGKYGAKAGDALTKAKDIYLAGGWDNDVSGEKRKIADWTFGIGLPKNSPLARLYNIAVDQGAIRRSSGYDVVQGRQEKYTESDYVGKKVFMEQALGWTFQNSERFNREVTLIAAFNLEMEKNGGNVNAAAQYAIDFVNDVHGTTLNETAPRYFQTNVGRVLFVFKNFAQTQIFLQYRLLREVLKGADRETQKVAAKQFAGIMGMAFLFAGVQGLPLYGAASVIAGMVENLFGDDDNPMDPDEYLRQAISSLAYKGPLSQALQVDIASRTGFNNLLWREDDKRIEEIGPFLFAAEQIFGASYAAGMSLYRAWNDCWDGHTYRALEAATPAAIRNGLKAFRFTVEGAKTRDGQVIVKDINAYNSVMQALGFSPLEFAEKSTAAGKIAAQQSLMEKRKKAIYDKIYLAYINGNKEDLEEALAAKDKFNQSPAVAERRMFIKDQDIRRSIQDRQRRAQQSIYGIYVPPKSKAAYDKYKPEGYDEGT